MRLGIFGGSFDPVHLGHLLLAESAREQARLDRLLFVPAAQQPLKPPPAASDRQRLQMLELAIGGQRPFQISTLELDRGGVSYTFETLTALSDQHRGDALYFLLGADSLVDLPHWREPRRICELATLLIACRPGAEMPDLQQIAASLDLELGSTFRAERFEMPQVELSSRDLRQRVGQGRSIRFRVPRAVERYIESEQLYREPATPSGESPRRS